jgi:hypothetical protein
LLPPGTYLVSFVEDIHELTPKSDRQKAVAERK